MILIFPDRTTLHWALTSGAVPREAVARPAVSGTLGDAVWVRTGAAIPDVQMQVLADVGVTCESGDLGDGRHAANWLQVIQPVRSRHEPDIRSNTVVLFEFADEASWAAAVGEMLRLGNDRLEARVPAAGRPLLRVVGPPYYSLLPAIDREGGQSPRVFLERSARLWVEFGYDYPLTNWVRVPANRLATVNADGEWVIYDDAEWRDAGAFLAVREADCRDPGREWSPAGPLEIPLEVVDGGAADGAELWVVEKDAWQIVDTFVGSADATLLERLAVAVGSGEGGPVAVLRWRPGAPPPVEFPIEATPYRPYARIPHLFIPLGRRIDPPLGRETLRKLLADDPEQVVWLDASGQGRYTRRCLPDEAFRPLADWADVVLARHRDELLAWQRASEFDFAVITAIVEDAVEDAKPDVPAAPRKGSTPQPRAEPVVKPKEPARARPARPAKPAPSAPVAPEHSREQLIAVEQEFLAVDGPLDHPRRRELWPRLATLNFESGSFAEAALCWAHSVWDAEPADPEHLRQWVQTEHRLNRDTLGDKATALLQPENLPRECARAFAAFVAWTQRQNSDAVQQYLPAWQKYLLMHEQRLPVRHAWLAWSAWSKLAGGDALALARARDRMLARLLEQGLNAEADLPQFLRFAGRADADRLRQLRGWVDDMRTRLTAWLRADVDSAPTTAYFDLLFAFGLARLGEASSARALVQAAAAMLSGSADDVREAHTFLLQAYSWRIEEVIAGRPHGGPLPTEQLDYLTQMHAEVAKLPTDPAYKARRIGPYAIERLREQSNILEPQEKFYPYRRIVKEQDELVRRALQLPDESDSTRLASRISDLLRESQTRRTNRLTVLEYCVAMTGRLPSEAANDLLDKAGTALDAAGPPPDNFATEQRLRILERTLFFAAHFGRDGVAQGCLERLVGLLDGDLASTVLDATGAVLGQTIRGLRKLGLRDQAMSLIDRMNHVLLKGQDLEQARQRRPGAWPNLLHTLLHLAAGWQYFEKDERASPILAAARGLVLRASRPKSERVLPQPYVQIVCGYIVALGQGKPAEARARIAELFDEGRLDRLPNNFTSNDYYSRFHLNVAEAVVMTLASDDFALGPIARRWLDDDEFIVRRRIHSDVRTVVEAGQRR